MQKRSLVGGLLNCSCPRCRQGAMFEYPAFHPTKFMRMNETCPHCGVRLQPEPGFYQGAMYVQYGFAVAIIVAVGLLLYFLFTPSSEWVYIGTIIGIIVLLAPLNYRYSRAVYLYAFGGIKYDRDR